MKALTPCVCWQASVCNVIHVPSTSRPELEHGFPTKASLRARACVRVCVRVCACLCVCVCLLWRAKEHFEAVSLCSCSDHASLEQNVQPPSDNPPASVSLLLSGIIGNCWLGSQVSVTVIHSQDPPPIRQTSIWEMAAALFPAGFTMSLSLCLSVHKVPFSLNHHACYDPFILCSSHTLTWF